MLLMLFFVISVTLPLTKCEKVTFENITVLYYISLNEGVDPLSINIESSNSLTVPPNEDAVYKIEFEDEKPIPVLYENSVSNFTELKELYLDDHEINEIYVNAFENLPSLEILSLKQNKLKDLKKGVVNNLRLRFLYLDNNIIELIAPQAFDNLNHLMILSLKANKIKDMYSQWFHDKPFLKIVALHENIIEKIPNRTLTSFKGEIFLDGNNIKEISHDIFGQGHKIMTLSLRDNEIETWDENLLKNTQVGTFDITYNKIKCLKGNLSNFFVANYSYIGNNPWKCHCILEIEKWANQNNKHFEVGFSLRKCKKISRSMVRLNGTTKNDYRIISKT